MEHGYWSLLALAAAAMVMFRWFQGGDWSGRGRRRRETAGLEEETRQQLLEQSGRAEALEIRVAELENRLDFTERLLAGRRDASLAGSYDP